MGCKDPNLKPYVTVKPVIIEGCEYLEIEALKNLLYASQRYAYLGASATSDIQIIEKEFDKQCRILLNGGAS